MGLTVSDAIRLLLLRVADEKRLPFEVKVPNAKSRRAMKNWPNGRADAPLPLQGWASEVLGPVVEPFKRDVRRAESQGA
jgi:hypothetical protein